MERRLKERLIGAAVLVMLAVIFIPMVLDNSVETDTAIRATNIPPRPQTEFRSKISPLTESELALESVPKEVGVIRGEVTRLLDEAPKVPPESAPEPITRPEPQVAAAPAKPGTKSATASVPAVSQGAADSMGVTAWVVQLGSFSSAANANALNQKLRAAAYPSFVEPLRQPSGEMAYRVRVGPELLRSDAQALKEKLDKTLEKEKIKGLVVRYP